MNGRMIKLCSDINSLETAVTNSITKAIERYNRPGWLKYDDYLYENFIVFPEGAAHLESITEKKLHDKNSAKVKIICLGSGLYGHFIERIFLQYSHIEVEVVVFSPFDKYPGNESNRKLLAQAIKDMLEKTKNTAKVYLTETFPTIRAILICDKNNNPLFCTIQPYYIYNDVFTYAKGSGHTPSFFADKNNKKLIHQLAKTFMDEFTRLKGTKDKPVTIEEVKEAIFIYNLQIE